MTLTSSVLDWWDPVTYRHRGAYMYRPAIVLIVLGCQSREGDQGLYTELRDQGADRYLGAFCPSESINSDTGVIAHEFPAALDGPMCLYGTDFHTMTHDQGSEDLVVFLQGGGLCYSELCIAVSSGGAWLPTIDILDTEATFNPIRDWNQVYVPYCDGSLFAGDIDIDDDGDGKTDRHHRGLMNLSAAIDVAAQSFPEPRRVLLAGSSGGGYGTMTAAVLARWSWPDADLYVFNDAGIGLGIDGDSSFIDQIMTELNAHSIIPDSQSDLLADGHLTPFIGWQLEQDPDLQISAFSYTWDYVISQIYLAVSYENFESWLRQETAALQSAHPERYQYFLPDGSRHTTLLGDPSGFVDTDSLYYDLIADMLGGMDTTAIDGMSVGSWMEAFVDGSPSWVSMSD